MSRKDGEEPNSSNDVSGDTSLFNPEIIGMYTPTSKAHSIPYLELKFYSYIIICPT